MDEWLTPKEAAARLRVSINTLRDWRRLKKGPKFYKIGHLVRYRAAELESCIKVVGHAVTQASTAEGGTKE